MNSIIKKKYKVAFIVLIILITVSLISCAGEPKYTYEEYKKIKAIDRKENSGSTDIKVTKDEYPNEDELQSYFDDLNDYNLYMEEFRFLYDKHAKEILLLSGGFDNETEDLEKKNQYAYSIIDLEEKWIIDLEEVEVPEYLKVYNDYFIGFLNNNVLFYKFFLEADLEKANGSSVEADDFYEKSLMELETIEKNFNNRAKSLNLEIPF